MPSHTCFGRDDGALALSAKEALDGQLCGCKQLLQVRSLLATQRVEGQHKLRKGKQQQQH